MTAKDGIKFKGPFYIAHALAEVPTLPPTLEGEIKRTEVMLTWKNSTCGNVK